MRSSASSQGPRRLVSRRSAQLDELEGTNGSLLVSAEVQVDVEREDCPSPFGQHYNSVLSEKTRFAKICETTFPYSVDSRVLQSEQHYFGSGTSERRDECSGGPGFEFETSFESELVPHLVESVQIESVQATEIAHPLTNDSTGSNVGRHRVLESSRLATVIKGFLKDKASDDTISIVKKAHADSSLRQYQSIWGKFLDFLSTNSINHDSVGIADVMNFMYFHAIQLKREYRTIAAYKFAI